MKNFLIKKIYFSRLWSRWADEHTVEARLPALGHPDVAEHLQKKYLKN
jgi:hypothetical protein